MANPATKKEVETVLSSIRRMVGEVKQDSIGETGREGREMLVLTPQLRVVETTGVLQLTPEHAVPLQDTHPAQGNDVGVEPRVRYDDAMRVIDSPRKAVDAPVRRDVSELSAKIEALETAIARTVDTWEPDEPGRDAYAGTQLPAMNWGGGIELDAHGKPIAESQAPVAAHDEKDTAEDDDLILDEESLRELVSQIVRSELQGELGERITRNVRKLVRREIQRALDAQAVS